MNLARVKAQLRNYEPRARRKFLPQFVVLPHLLRFQRFKGAGDRSCKESRCLEYGLASRLRDLSSLIEFGDKTKQGDRVQVEYRLGGATIPGLGKIAGHDEQVANVRPLQSIKHTFQLVAILVFAGQVNQRLDAEAADLGAKHLGRDCGAAAGIVGNG